MNSSTARVDSTQGRPKRPNFFRLYKAINRAYPQLGGALTQALHVYLEHGDENDVTYVSPAGVARVMGHADDREAKKLKQEAVSRGWLRKVPAPAGFVRPKGMRGPPAFHQVCVPETVVQEATVSGETGVRDTTVYEETVVDQPPKRGCGGRGNSGVADSERVVFGTTRTKKNKEEQTQTKTDPACVALLIDRGIDPEVARGLALVAAAKGRDNVFVAAVVDHAFDPARRVHNPADFIQSRLIGGFQPPAGNGKPRTAPPTKDFSFCV